VWPETDRLAAVSLTWRDAPTAVRAAVAQELGDEVWAGAVAQGATGLLEVHTCARSLWVVAGEPAAWVGALVQAHVTRRAGVAPTLRVGRDAARFALAVAVGLDSFVQGEADVGRQMTRAFEASRKRGRLDGTLNLLERGVARLLAQAHRSGWVRPNRGVGQLAVSWLAAQGADPSRPVGVVGTGAIGQRVVASLARAGWAPPVRYNRTPREGVAGLDAIGAHEALVVCTAGRSAWLDADARWVVDLGTPAQVRSNRGGAIAGLETLLAGDALGLPSRTVADANAAVERETDALGDKLRAAHRRRALAEARELRDRFLNDALQEELATALEGLDSEQRRRVVRAASAAIRRYNHQLVAWLREGREVL